MSFEGRDEVREAGNVIPMFSTMERPQSRRIEDIDFSDVEMDIDLPAERETRLLVSEAQFPDQSMYVISQQIQGLRERLDRLKFYLSDLDDLLPT